jgi:hypothetical protein
LQCTYGVSLSDNVQLTGQTWLWTNSSRVCRRREAELSPTMLCQEHKATDRDFKLESFALTRHGMQYQHWVISSKVKPETLMQDNRVCTGSCTVRDVSTTNVTALLLVLACLVKHDPVFVITHPATSYLLHMINLKVILFNLSQHGSSVIG